MIQWIQFTPTVLSIQAGAVQKVQLEAGKEYYFLQDVHMGAWKARTGLSMHARKIGLYELTGAYYSNWKRNK